jgi:hypothetical protein
VALTKGEDHGGNAGGDGGGGGRFGDGGGRRDTGTSNGLPAGSSPSGSVVIAGPGGDETGKLLDRTEGGGGGWPNDPRPCPFLARVPHQHGGVARLP